MKDYLAKLNGTTKLLIQTGTIIAAVVVATIGFEARYAKATDVEAVQVSVQSMVAAMLATQIAERTALEIKQAQEGLTPVEEVKLNGLRESIKALQGGG